jgi:hypothetical protein
MLNYFLAGYYTDCEYYIILKFINLTSNNRTSNDLAYILNTIFKYINIESTIKIFYEIVNDTNECIPISDSIEIYYDPNSDYDIDHIYNTTFKSLNVLYSNKNIIVKIDISYNE